VKCIVWDKSHIAITQTRQGSPGGLICQLSNYDIALHMLQLNSIRWFSTGIGL